MHGNNGGEKFGYSLESQSLHAALRAETTTVSQQAVQYLSSSTLE